MIMKQNNYVYVPEPDSYIKLGLKDGALVCVDWSDIADCFVDEEDRIKGLIAYLELAKLMLGPPKPIKINNT